eukprot:125671-Pyramimonas_sp.AAC.1
MEWATVGSTKVDTIPVFSTAQVPNYLDKNVPCLMEDAVNVMERGHAAALTTSMTQRQQKGPSIGAGRKQSQ